MGGKQLAAPLLFNFCYAGDVISVAHLNVDEVIQVCHSCAMAGLYHLIDIEVGRVLR